MILRHEITRRSVLKSAAAGAAMAFGGLRGTIVGPGCAAAATPAGALKIQSPFHGAILDHRHGKQTADSLRIRVSGEAKADGPVTVNGVVCRRQGTRFEGDMVLREPETDLIAVSGAGADRREDRVRVVWDRYSVPRYRFAIDDTSFVFRDIARKKYASIFDCFFLKGLRDLHKKYGATFVLNCYYVAADNIDFPKPGDFTLAEFPTRYMSEWRDNSHWLKLAFHAYANMPSRPYEHTPPEKLIEDMNLVDAEIRRFAGDETFSHTTCIHFGLILPSAFKPLFQNGVRVLSTDFYHNYGGKVWDVALELPDAVCEYCTTHDAWKDFESGIVVSMVDIVCNKFRVDQIAGVLQPLANNPNRSEIMDLFTHEQYFWPFYQSYIPDHFQRVEAAIRWVTEHGYKPVFFHEGLLGGRV